MAELQKPAVVYGEGEREKFIVGPGAHQRGDAPVLYAADYVTVHSIALLAGDVPAGQALGLGGQQQLRHPVGVHIRQSKKLRRDYALKTVIRRILDYGAVHCGLRLQEALIYLHPFIPRGLGGFGAGLRAGRGRGEKNVCALFRRLRGL